MPHQGLLTAEAAAAQPIQPGPQHATDAPRPAQMRLEEQRALCGCGRRARDGVQRAAERLSVGHVAGQTGAQQPLVVGIEHGESVPRELTHHRPRLVGPAEVGQQAGKRRPVQRIPRKFLDGGTHVRLELGQAALLPAQEEPMEPPGRDVVAGNGQARVLLDLLLDEPLRLLKRAFHERQERARRDPEPAVRRLAQVDDEAAHFI